MAELSLQLNWLSLWMKPETGQQLQHSLTLKLPQRQQWDKLQGVQLVIHFV